MATTRKRKAEAPVPPPPPSLVQPLTISYQDRPLDLKAIRPSKTNPRDVFDQVALDQLAASIRQVGVMQPLVVRPVYDTPGEYFEIVFGERRFRASTMAGLTEVPCRVAQLSDEAVVELQLIENLMREDVHPLAEAEGYRRLVDMGKTPEEIGERIGKDRSYVYRRMQLANLSERARELFRAGSITIQHANRIARLSNADAQLVAVNFLFPNDWDEETREYRQAFDKPTRKTAGMLDRFIAEKILLALKRAPWKLDDSDLIPSAGPCTTCEKRSGANMALFDDAEVPKDDACLDAGCFSAKTNAFVQIELQKAAAAEKTLVPISEYWEASHRPKRPEEFESVDSDFPDDEDDVDLGAARMADGAITFRSNYTLLTGHDKCSHSEDGIIVDGGPSADVGARVKICRSTACPKHGARNSSMGSGSSRREPLTWAEKRKRLDDRIKIEVNDELIRMIGDQDPSITDSAALLTYLVDWCCDRASHDGRRALARAIGAVKPPKSSYGWEERAIKEWATGKNELAVILALSVASPFRSADVNQVCKLLGIQVANVSKRIAQPLIDRFEARKAKATGSGKAKKKTAAKKTAAKKTVKPLSAAAKRGVKATAKSAGGKKFIKDARAAKAKRKAAKR